MQTPVFIFHAADERGASEALLVRAARRYADITGADFSPRSLVRPSFGKPRFTAEGSPEFSVTHSGGRWLCAFSEQPVGLDIQQRRRVDVERLARRFFHPEEAALVFAQPDEFFRIWCAKESYLKFTGEGLSGLEAVCTVSPEGGFPSVPGVNLQLLPLFAGYSACLCTASPAEIREQFL